MFEEDCAEKAEEHSVVRFNPMDKFKRGCELSFDLTGQIIHDLDSMVHFPEPMGSRHLHVSDAGASHSHNGLPVSFSHFVLVLSARRGS